MEKRNAKGQTEEEFLRSYNPRKYQNPAVTVDMLVMGIDESYENLKILLVRRNNHPYIGCWALPGGFINPDESAYRAARDAINGWDPSGGAIYYFNPATATSAWIWSRPLITVIGKHRFCA